MSSGPPPSRRAVIDIGTNSVKLLVADVVERSVIPVTETSEQTRLGQGFYESHRLQRSNIEHTAQAVAAFVKRAKELQSLQVRVIATSAARDASNAAELLDEVKRQSGLAVEVISGDQEADWAFYGVTSDPTLGTATVLVMDVGGGSTELVLGEPSRILFRDSFHLGSVRLLEQLTISDPPLPVEYETCRQQIRQLLEGEVKPAIQQALGTRSLPAMELVATGGTTSILARIEHQLTDFDRDRIEGTRLSLERLRAILDQLWSVPLAARREIIGLPPNRADVILTGAAICHAVVEQFGLRELRVSTRGMRFGAVLADRSIPQVTVPV